MPELTAFGGIGTQFALFFRTLHFVAVGIPDRDPGALDERHVTLFEETEAPRHGQQGRHIGSDEVLIDSVADDDRAALASQYELPGVAATHDDERVCAFEFFDGSLDGLGQVVGCLEVPGDSVSHDLRVRVSDEIVPGPLEILAKLFVVFDDAVVNDRDDVARHVRVRIGLIGHSVRSPTCVRDALRSTERVFFQRIRKLLDLAHAPDAADLAVLENGDTGRVIAPILEPAKAFQQDGDNVSFGNGADNSAHGSNASEFLHSLKNQDFFVGFCQ